MNPPEATKQTIFNYFRRGFRNNESFDSIKNRLKLLNNGKTVIIQFLNKLTDQDVRTWESIKKIDVDSDSKPSNTIKEAITIKPKDEELTNQPSAPISGPNSQQYTTAGSTTQTSTAQPVPEKAEVKTSVTYSLLLSRIDSENELSTTIIEDIHYAAIIRTPIIKQASYVLMSVMYPIDKLAELEENINSGIFPVWDFSCYEENSVDGKIVDSKLLFDTPVVIVSFSRQKEDKGFDNLKSKTQTPVKLLLLDPAVKQMAQNTGANKIYYGISVKDAILGKQTNQQSFLSYIGNKYFDGIADTYTEAENLAIVCCGGAAIADGWNPQTFNQITVPSTIPEINSAEYMINTYKVFPTFGFVFFDQFWRYDHNHEPNRMTCIIMSLHKLKQFLVTYDITELLDVQANTHTYSTSTFTDPFNELVKPGASFLFKEISNMRIEKVKASDIVKTVKSIGDRLVNQVEMNSVSSKIVKFPDSITNAKKRIEESVQLMTDKIEMIKTFETIKTSPLWLQFGRIYNMDFDAKGINAQKYSYTPLSIINIFKRLKTKETSMDHIVKYTMLRLYEEETPVVVQQQSSTKEEVVKMQAQEGFEPPPKIQNPQASIEGLADQLTSKAKSVLSSIPKVSFSDIIPPIPLKLPQELQIDFINQFVETERKFQQQLFKEGKGTLETIKAERAKLWKTGSDLTKFFSATKQLNEKSLKELLSRIEKL